MSTLADKATDAGAGRPDAGDGRRRRGASGARGGTSGGPIAGPAGAYLTAAALVALIDVANVVTTFHEAHGAGVTVPVLRPPLLELTSGLALLASMPIVRRVASRAGSPRRAPLRFMALHIAGAVAFSAAHVILMLALRYAAFGFVGQRYHYGAATLPYDFVKDLIAYVGFAGLFWLFDQFPRPTSPAAPAAAAGEAPMVDIRDGPRLLRTPAQSVLAVRAAGNYVEFLLAGGERPLMRETLAATQRRFAGLGFVRTHRSWLVNAARVRGLEPEGSGDYELDLGGGVRAPLSRRFPEALAALRGDS